MPEKNKKRICKVCPKRKKKSKAPIEPGITEEEILELPIEEEEEEGVVVDELPCQGEVESIKDLATGGFVLDEIVPERSKLKPPFFCPTAPRSRYENMVPVDVVNDHQLKASLEKTVIDHMVALRVTSEPFCKRLPAIIATIGPSCSEVDKIEELLQSGMNIARINMAYGDRCCQLNAIRNFKEAVTNFHGKLGMKIPVGLMIDLKGPEIRTGRICRLYACDPENPEVLIEKGSIVKLSTEAAFVDKCTPNFIYIDYPRLGEFVRPGMIVYIDDGSIQLFVREVKENFIVTSVEVEGYLRNYRPVHLPMVPMPAEEITDIDAEDIEMAIEEEVDFIVVSKVQSPDVVSDLRGKLIESLLSAKKLRERPIMILAKISNFQAIRNIDGIIKAVDGVIIQRGDLGLELPLEKIYIAQKEIIGKCNLANKPVICSTHLMWSMIRRPLADRSNVFDVGCCIEDGADAVCLTGETAVGIYPAYAIEQTHHILREAQAADARKSHFNEMVEKLKPPVEPIVAVGMAACMVAEKLKASAILVLTSSGKSACIISWFRPRCPILAITRFERTAKQLHLWRAVCPLLYTGKCIKNNWFENLDLQFQFGIAFGIEVGFIKAGDPLVLVSGFGKSTGFTNFLRVVYVSTEPVIFLQHSKEFYDNIYIQRNCPRTEAAKACSPSR